MKGQDRFFKVPFFSSLTAFEQSSRSERSGRLRHAADQGRRAPAGRRALEKALMQSYCALAPPITPCRHQFWIWPVLILAPAIELEDGPGGTSRKNCVRLAMSGVRKPSNISSGRPSEFLTGGMADMNRILQVEGAHKFGDVIGPGVDLIAGVWLDRPCPR